MNIPLDSDLVIDPASVNAKVLILELLISIAEREGELKRFSLTDSHIRSTIHKLRKAVQGELPKKLPGGTPREDALFLIYATGLKRCTDDAVRAEGVEQSVVLFEWANALRIVEDNIKALTGGSGSRDFLDWNKARHPLPPEPVTGAEEKALEGE